MSATEPDETELTTAEVAAEYQAALESIKPYRDKFTQRLTRFLSTVKDFHRANSWYSDEMFGWVEHYNVHSGTSELADEGVYLSDNDGFHDIEEFVGYEVMDSIEEILHTNYAEHKKAEHEREAVEREERRKKLLKELEELS